VAPDASPLLTERFRAGLVYAAELHQDQKRKGGEIPYLGHLLIVAGTVIEWGGDEDEAIAGVLHDAIEDQPQANPRLEIRRRFGDKVADMVEGLSDADVQPKPPWLERKKAYFRRLEEEAEEIVLISAADKLHNARAILADYIERGDELWTRFSIKDQGALPQVWYLKNLLDIYERRLPQRLTRELRAVVEELASRTGLSVEDLPEPV
jgi:(p)ppGpp synthase/HD superfamily hydrolase